MKKYFLFSLLIIIVWQSCDNRAGDISFDKTEFRWSIEGEIKGKIESKDGMASISCENDRTIIVFEENFENRSDTTDVLIGELILGIQKGDTTGIFALKGISENRTANTIGIVALLNILTYDESMGQYISEIERYETVQSGEVSMEKWSSSTGGIVKGV